jgi:hypothetical protein
MLGSRQRSQDCEGCLPRVEESCSFSRAPHEADGVGRECPAQPASICFRLFLGEARDTLFLNVELCARLNLAISPPRYKMSVVERTAAGLQSVIPGCERRTLPKSTTRVDDSGQGLLHFYKPPTLREELETRAEAPLQPTRGQKAMPKSGLFSAV